MSNTSISLINQYPKDKYTLLIPIETIAKISEIQSPVISAIKISTNLDDKQIYEQEKAYNGKPARYALMKNGLTRLMLAAGIKMLSSCPVVPSTCQKCANMNASIGKPIRCGGCPNKDVKYECRISVPQLTGEEMEIVAHKEILVDDVTAGMSDKQKLEFLKFRNEICESKALNRALRTAMQIKGTYSLEELQKPFVVAYLVPNLDNPDVKRVAIESMFSSTRNLFGNQAISEQKVIEAHEQNIENAEYQDVYQEINQTQDSSVHQEPKQNTMIEHTEDDRTQDFSCDKCNVVIPQKVWDYSCEHYGIPLCYKCQKADRNGGK